LGNCQKQQRYRGNRHRQLADSTVQAGARSVDVALVGNRHELVSDKVPRADARLATLQRQHAFLQVKYNFLLLVATVAVAVVEHSHQVAVEWHERRCLPLAPVLGSEISVIWRWLVVGHPQPGQKGQQGRLVGEVEHPGRLWHPSGHISKHAPIICWEFQN